MVISIGVLSGIMLAVSMFGLDIHDFGIFLGENLIAQQELQLTLKVIVSEMRGMAQSVNGAYLIESVSQNEIVFYSDRDGDGFTERIRYFLDSNVFKKGVIEASGNPLAYSEAENITEVVHNVYTAGGNIFGYYDSSYSGTESELSFPVNIPLIRLIKITLIVDPNPADPSSRVNFSTSVSIRNL